VFIEIEHLKPEPFHIRHTYSLTDLPLGSDDTVLAESAVVDLALTREDRDLRLQGSVKTAVRCQCARCLKGFALSVDTLFTLFYLPHPEVSGEEEEIQLRYEDLDIGFYDGIRFDVDAMIVEQIYLNMPMKLVCSETCRGLCATCGSDLNEKSCRCADAEADPRLEVLLEFRKKMNRQRRS